MKNLFIFNSSILPRVSRLLFYLVLLVIGEFVAAIIIPYDFDANTKYYRNPFLKRAWPEFIDNTAIQRIKTKKIVVISNSQGYGRETSVENLYTSQLEMLLEANGFNNYEVLNWSAVGARSMDFYILLAKALQLNAEIVILNTFSRNFDRRGDRNLNFSMHDIDLVLAQEGVKEGLSEKYLSKMTTNGDQFYSKLILNSDLLRLRYYIDDQFNDKNESKEIIGFKEDFETNMLATGIPGEKCSTLTRHLSEKVEELVDICANSGTNIFINHMPLNVDFVERRSLVNIRRFNQELRKYVSDYDHIRMNNYTNRINNEYYYSYTHFDYRGHSEFAKLMYSDIVSILSNESCI